LPPPPHVARKDISVFFDVGANVGKYTNIIREALGDEVVIYSFEPSKQSYKKLLQNTEGYSGLHRFNFGFGKESSVLTLYSDSEASGLASLYKRNLQHFDIEMNRMEEVEIRTIDDFCFTAGIQRITFLKMDVEGNELNVLLGAKKMLDAGSIDFIQFEFGGCNIDSRTYFQDFYYLLKDRYTIYRIVKDGFFEIKKYNEIYECFITTNFFAARKDVL
jgi:FkbM family methyltransferase